jgi:hypothetical protein
MKKGLTFKIERQVPELGSELVQDGSIKGIINKTKGSFQCSVSRRAFRTAKVAVVGRFDTNSKRHSPVMVIPGDF